MPKVVVVNPIIPHPEHDVHSVNVVIFELIRSLAQTEGFEVHFLKIDVPGDPAPSEAERAGIDKMRNFGVVVHEPLRLPPMPGSPPVRTLADITLRTFMPVCAHSEMACAAVEKLGVDVVMIPWSEWVTALLADVKLVKFAYYGNPDPKTRAVRVRLRKRLLGMSDEDYQKEMNICSVFQDVHLECMLKYHILGDVAENDARYYQLAGHPNAFYIQNVWIDRYGDRWQSMRDEKEEKGPVAKIIGSIGNLAATANTHGLEFIATRLLPEMRRQMADIPFELHIIGPAEPWPMIADLLKGQPEIRMRGFIDDIDHEMMSAPVFLNVNNATDFKVGHTRYLHAWSIGCCTVAHHDAALAMPEIRHEENALLGGNAAEMAACIRRALLDRDLRRRIGEGGYQTRKAVFNSDAVARHMADRIRVFC